MKNLIQVLILMCGLLIQYIATAQTPRELADRIGNRIIADTKFEFEKMPMKFEQEKVHIFDFSQLKNYKPAELYLEQFNVTVDSSLIGKKGLSFGISSTSGMITVNFQFDEKKYNRIRAYKSTKLAGIKRIDYDLIEFDTSQTILFDTSHAVLTILFAPDTTLESRVYLGIFDEHKTMLGGLKITPTDTAAWKPTPSVSTLAKGNQNMVDWRYYNGTLAIAMHDAWLHFGIDKFKPYLNNHINFFLENRDKIKAERDKYGLIDSPFSLYFRGMLLDDLGMQTAAVALSNNYTIQETKTFKTQTDLIQDGLEKIKKNVPTLPDGTFTRVTPDSLTVQSDDLMMGGYAYLRMGLSMKKPEYVAEAAKQSLNFHKYLLDKQTGLYRHAYSTKTGQQSCCSWARGMGWMMLVNTELLKNTPPQYETILANYKASCEALLKFQNENGSFNQVLTDKTTYLETSATAMFVYAFAEGVNKGWLPKAQFESAILRGWSYLKTQIQEDGNVKNIVRGTPILPTTEAYNKQKANTSDPRGLGAMLWVCMAMDKYFKK
jgi:rhamnogalacturonyl hydrolase YesR